MTGLVWIRSRRGCRCHSSAHSYIHLDESSAGTTRRRAGMYFVVHGSGSRKKHLNGNGSQLRDINRRFVPGTSMANQRHSDGGDKGKNHNNSD